MSNTHDESEHKPPQCGEVTGLPVGQMADIVTFQNVIRQAIAAAAERNWQKLIICDPNFEAWPLGEMQVIADLNRWIGRSKTFVMLAHEFDTVRKQHARFVNWRSTWSHCIQCCTIATFDQEPTQTMLWSPEWGFALQDNESFAGNGSENPRFRAEMQSLLDNLQRKAEAGFPIHVLGL